MPPYFNCERSAGSSSLIVSDDDVRPSFRTSLSKVTRYKKETPAARTYGNGIVKITVPVLTTTHRETGIMTITLFHLANEMLSMIARRSIVGQHHAGLVVIFSIWPADIEVISEHRPLPGKTHPWPPGARFALRPRGLFNYIAPNSQFVQRAFAIAQRAQQTSAVPPDQWC